jgi:hypothetical protein
MNNIDSPDSTLAPPKYLGNYEAFVLVNATSSQAPAAYGTLAHTAMLNDFVKSI